MILYRLARWMDELTQIRRLIRLSAGDTKELVREKEQMKRKMLTFAEIWASLPMSASLPLTELSEPTAHVGDLKPSNLPTRTVIAAPLETWVKLPGFSLEPDDEELESLIAAVAQYPTYTNEEVIET